MWFCVLFLSFLIHLTSSDVPKPVVSIPSGTLRGSFHQTTEGKKYAAFEGIPYARPPVGKYRFREPQPVKSWRGIWEANYLHTCLQYNHYVDPKEDRVIGNEDCLYLNVYTPQLNQAALLDVVVYIHGGAFMFGAGHYYGEKLIMNRDVVYVNLNYRLGPLGFLSTEDNVVPGNNGMKDQVLALKWIKNNIQYFGGNPDSITLTGMSAGGASTHLHYMSPLSTGLFNRGFSMSGTALNSWVLAENSLQKARKLASSVGCNFQTTKEMVDCLRYRPARQIVQNVEHFFIFLYNPFSPFGVVIEPQETLEPFLSEHPYQILKSGKIQDLPWMTSVVQSEGLYPASEFIYDSSYLPEIESRWLELAPHILDYNYTTDVLQHNEIAEKSKTQYLKEKPISKSTFNELVQLIGDRLFVADSQLAARMQAQVMTSPVYYYYFTYRGAHSKSETLSNSTENFGASHGDDTVYVLSSNININTTQNDRTMSQILLDLWTSYAKTGEPLLSNSPWTRVSSNPQSPLNYKQICLPECPGEKTSFNFGNNEFWQSLPLQENKNLFPAQKVEL